MIKIREFNKDEKLYTSEGFLQLPDIEHQSRDIEDGDFQIEILFNSRWIKAQNIDFE